MKVKSESEVAQSCLTLSNLMDCHLPGSSVHGIFQARVLEWGAIMGQILYLELPIFINDFSRRKVTISTVGDVDALCLMFDALQTHRL